MIRAVLVLAAALAAAPADAQTAKESPGRVAPDTATSTCLGQTATPACAAETLLACLVRADAGLCRAVGTPTPARETGSAAMQLEYVIERVSTIRPDDITDEVKDLDWYKPGYALVEMLRRACPAAPGPCADDSWDDLQVYLRRRPDTDPPRWDAVHWRSESEPDVAPELPDAFLRRDPPSR